MKRFRMLGVAAVLALAALAVLPVSHADAKVGVILMHGKDGNTSSSTPIGKLAAKLKGRFDVKVLDMPWSSTKKFGGTLVDAFAQIDAAVQSMRSSGVTKIVVGGNSMGANAALAYATQRAGLAGILMTAPGHQPKDYAYDNEGAIRTAKANVAAGRPDATVKIVDYNQNRGISRTLKSSAAISFFDPKGMAVMASNAPKVKPGTPVFWVIGEKDSLHPVGRTAIYDKIPAHPKSAYVVVPGGHWSAAIKGADKIEAWLSGL